MFYHSESKDSYLRFNPCLPKPTSPRIKTLLWVCHCSMFQRSQHLLCRILLVSGTCGSPTEHLSTKNSGVPLLCAIPHFLSRSLDMFHFIFLGRFFLQTPDSSVQSHVLTGKCWWLSTLILKCHSYRK